MAGVAAEQRLLRDGVPYESAEPGDGTISLGNAGTGSGDSRCPIGSCRGGWTKSRMVSHASSGPRRTLQPSTNFGREHPWLGLPSRTCRSRASPRDQTFAGAEPEGDCGSASGA
jgi:hypothetical protein